MISKVNKKMKNVHNIMKLNAHNPQGAQKWGLRGGLALFLTIAFAGLSRNDFAFHDHYKLIAMKILTVVAMLSFLIFMVYAFLLNKKVEFGQRAFATKLLSV